MSQPQVAAPAPPASERERVAQTIAALFDEVLGQVGCGPEDRFFQLGGDSLGGLRMLTRLNEEFGVNIGVADLYTRTTPLALADRLLELRARPEKRRRSLESTARRRRGKPLPLALTQEGLYAIGQVTRGVGFFNSVVLIQLTGDVDVSALSGAIGDVAARQTMLRTVFCEDQGRPGQRIVEDPPDIKMLDLRGRGGKALHRLTQMEYLRGFDLHAGPPVRFTIARTAADTWSLVMAVHHIIFDGLSQEILLDELAHAYRCRAGEGSARPPLRTDYLDFAEWQRDVLRGDRLEEHLADLSEILREPAPRIAPRESAGRFTTRIDDFTVPADTVMGLERLAAKHDSTLFITLLAAVTDFAQRRSGTRRQALTIQTANRSRPGTEHIIGCFANMLCLDIDADVETSPADSLRAIQASLARALAHEEIPLDYAITALDRRGNDLVGSGHMPQIGFTLQSLADEAIELPGCAMIARAILQEAENFDPTSFPLVIELAAAAQGLEGKTHRLLDMWPEDSFAMAERELASAFERFARLG